jgi:hypothetical protein
LVGLPTLSGVAQGKLKLSTWLWMRAFTNAVQRAAK